MTTTKEEYQVISKIANRAIGKRINLHNDRLSLLMDIENTHETIPLRLSDLLHADDFNFAHDVIGIQQNLNRDTKQMDNFFLPRFAI